MMASVEICGKCRLPDCDFYDARCRFRVRASMANLAKRKGNTVDVLSDALDREWNNENLIVWRANRSEQVGNIGAAL